MLALRLPWSNIVINGCVLQAAGLGSAIVARRFLYLANRAHAEAWMRGGPVPLRTASTYRKNERAGTGTPDENRTQEAPDGLTGDEVDDVTRLFDGNFNVLI